LAPAALASVLAVQAAGVVGMALHPATQQTYRDALAAVAPALGPGSLLLVPEGNDGVGIVGAVLAEAPRDQALLVLRTEDASQLPERVAGYRRLVLLGITDRDGAVQAEAARAVLHGHPGWTELPEGWRDLRRGYFAAVFRSDGGSGMADRAERLGIRDAHHRGEQP
uniref:hypothetical protein n=1 Tax=Falsiroseomonas oryzae TaxID=2766473 RepID=UPI0022EAAE5F